MSPASVRVLKTPNTEQTRACLRRVAALSSFSRFELCTHCRDRGHALAPEARRELARAGLLVDGEVPESTRQLVLERARGQGLLITVDQGGYEPASAYGEFVQLISMLAHVQSQNYERAAEDLVALAYALSEKDFGRRAMAQWVAAAATLAGPHGRVTPALQGAITRVELELGSKMSRAARALFQELVGMTGGKLEGEISLPNRQVSYWLTGPHPLANYQSAPQLPKRADVAIIGAGLTGAAAAWYLSKAAERGLSVVVLDAGDPAGQATGKNGGNFELIPENFFGGYGTYDGLVAERHKFLQAAYPEVEDTAIRAHAQRTAETIIRFGLKNAQRMLETIEEAQIQCDLSRSGWLRLAMNAREEEALRAEVKLAQKLGADVRLLGPKTIAARYRLPAKFSGRLVKQNGNYHPFKFVTQELERCLERGVQLFTRTRVLSVASLKRSHHELETSRGTIKAKRVIVATNAFTAELFPELKDIRPFRSQIANYEHVFDPLGGITMTAKDGDIYANYPRGARYLDDLGVRRGLLHVGGGQDTEIADPHHVKPSRQVFKLSRQEVEATFAGTEKQPPSRVWAGPMAFVEGHAGLRLPVLGPLGTGARSGIFIAVWCNGYGGTGCHNAGAGAAEWALTGKVPEDMPPDVFGPERLFTREPQF